ncbi:MAG TPA: hypothetical protein VIK07_09765 [Bacteroidales bacterium]
MKKLFFSGLALIAFLLPTLGQDHDFNTNDAIPVVNTKITKEQIPAAVVKAFNTKFNISEPQTWSKFPFALKEYGWVYDIGAADLKPERYLVNYNTKNGDDFSAVYSAAGNLIESREASKNVPMPVSVQEALSKSKYKDWAVVGDKEIIRYYIDNDVNNVEQHFRVTVQKDNVKRSISFNYQAVGNK